jgi:hypothetical protein
MHLALHEELLGWESCGNHHLRRIIQKGSTLLHFQVIVYHRPQVIGPRLFLSWGSYDYLYFTVGWRWCHLLLLIWYPACANLSKRSLMFPSIMVSVESWCVCFPDKWQGENSLREAYRNQTNMSYNIVRPGGLTNKPGGKNEIIIEQGRRMFMW